MTESLNFEKLFAFLKAEKASDLHISPSGIYVRKNQKIYPVRTGPAQQKGLFEVLLKISAERHDLGICLHGQRLRLHRYSASGEICFALRLLKGNIASWEALKLPEILKEDLRKDAGLILIAGPTGSGKSTTLAAMIDWMGKASQRMILSLEDPVEYDFSSESSYRSLIRQREIGRDVNDYYTGIREALREDPDVLVIGELRERECARQLLSAAETGHLVLTTLHTPGCARSIERFTDFFPSSEWEGVRKMLAASLLFVLVQRLLPGANGKLQPAFEVMRASPAVRAMIREGKDDQLESIIQTSGHEGMVLLDQSLAGLVAESRVEEEQAEEIAASSARFRKCLKRAYQVGSE